VGGSEVFQNGAAFSICFYVAPYFCCKGCKSPLESTALLDCQGGASIHQLMREKQLRAKTLIANQRLDIKQSKEEE
jgi:hypothetical protein